ncbi:MAG: outer membrane protein assembly factor BamD [Verrucomicrobia bacterium]|nr:outer membrane protein assembly factor BamD [Verrucomicrobiota bacterium]
MRKLIVFSSLLLAFTLLTAPPLYAAVVYRPGEGFHGEEEDSGALEKSASEQLHKAQALESEGSLKKAIGAYRALLRGFPASGAASQAQFKIAQLNEQTGEPERAFEAYSKYILNYPRGKEFDTVVERQFGIAKAFLDGERRKLFGMKTFGSMERAQKMFEEIVKSAPYSKEAPLAQFNIGMALEKQGQYAEAIAAYQLATDHYPNDDVAGDAQYQIGYVQMHLIENGSNDAASRLKARDAFEDFTVRYPQSEKIPQARENIAKLSGTSLKKNLEVARFYEKTKNFKAATIYYKGVIQEGKDAPEAEEARKAIERMKGNVGEDALRSGPENAQTGNKAREARKMQAQVDIASRPDYAGPPAPVVPEETAPEKPKLRTSGSPMPEPALPSQ